MLKACLPVLFLSCVTVFSSPGFSTLSLFLSFSCKLFTVMDQHQLFPPLLLRLPCVSHAVILFLNQTPSFAPYSLSSSFITSSSHLFFVFFTSSERIPQVLLLPTLDLWGKTGQRTLRRAFYSVMVQSAQKTKAQRGGHCASARQSREEIPFASVLTAKSQPCSCFFPHKITLCNCWLHLSFSWHFWSIKITENLCLSVHCSEWCKETRKKVGKISTYDCSFQHSIRGIHRRKVKYDAMLSQPGNLCRVDSTTIIVVSQIPKPQISLKRLFDNIF